MIDNCLSNMIFNTAQAAPDRVRARHQAKGNVPNETP